PIALNRRFPAEEQGPKVRLRPESFADHYSQARQFYISQTPTEQRHIDAALIFELSKVETQVIRERMVSHLLNIDETLASKVGHALGFKS
ncbi:catalase-related domain-containing protein, partial [Rhizobium ruizarguesonis]